MARIVNIARYQADGTQVTREFDKMGRAGEQMSQRIQRGSQTMTPALRGIDSAAGVAQQKIQGLAGSAGSLGTVLTAMGPAGLAAAAAIGVLTLGFGALQNAARGAVRDLAAIADASSELGISTNFIQEFRYAVLGTGSDIGVADSALRSFSRNLGQLNTELGQRARGALEELGFSEADIRNMHSVEDALPRIIQRIGQLGTASQQQAVAQKLGLEGVLQVLQGGEEAFERASAAARNMGYVIDREMIQRAGEMNGQWTQAAAVIDTQFKRVLVELAPTFVDLATSIAQGTAALVDFLNAWKAVDDRATSTLRRDLARISRDQLELGGNAADGDAERGARLAGVRRGQGAFDAPLTQRERNDIAAYLQQRADRIITEINSRPQFNMPTPSGGGGGGSGGGGAAADAALNQMRAFVAQLEEEARVRARLGELRAENAKASDDELRAVVALEDDLRKLAEARERGVIASDEELRRLEDLRRGRDAEREAATAQAAEIARLNQIRAANDNLRRQVETPEERIRRELADLEKERAEGVGRDSGLIEARMRQLRDEYRALAEAQYEASLQGRILQGVIQGQIKNFEDLKRVLIAMVADAALREFFAMAGGGGGGFGGLLQRLGLGGLSLPGFGGGMIRLGGGPKVPFGGKRAAGGPMYPGQRFGVAEQGPEVMIAGGWGHVAPNAAVEGLAVLARLSRAMQAPANQNAAPPKVSVNITNAGGGQVEGQAETRIGADGSVVIDVMLTRQTESAIRSGRLNEAMRDQFNARSQMTRRG